MKPIVRGARCALLAVVAGLTSGSPALAEECCSHLGGSVQCPGTLPAGSRSLQFQEGGTLWQLPGGGVVLVPQTVFPACPPAAARPAAGSTTPTTAPSATIPSPDRPTTTTTPATTPSTPSTTTAPAAVPREAGAPLRASEPVFPDRGRAAQDRARGLIDGRPVIVMPATPATGQPPASLDDRIRRLGDEIRQGDRTVVREPAGAAPPAGTEPAKAPPPEKPVQTVAKPAECQLDLAVHRPISQDPSQTRVPKERQLRHGAFTLRNDDADAPVGALSAGHRLPVTLLPRTDLDIQSNPLENDLVRVRAANPGGLKNVYLFAFTLAAEANRRRNSPVSRTARPAPQANGSQLVTWTDAAKSAEGPVFAMPVDEKGQDFWVEGRLGGRYVLALGVVPEGADPRGFRYRVEGSRLAGPAIPAAADKPVVELGCLEQASLTVVVVDIFQQAGGTVRENAFDVYWSGIPHFRAAVWPGGGRYAWAADYRQGAESKPVPGRAYEGLAGGSPPGPAPASDAGIRPDALATGGSIAGLSVVPAGTVGGRADAADKMPVTGGLAVHEPPLETIPAGEWFAREVSPEINRNAADLYPHRISLAYTLFGGTADEETLVRAEPLEVILPQLMAIPAAQPQVFERPPRKRFGVQSTVRYTISDAFGRRIFAPDVSEYLLLYGAALVAWEALRPEEGHARETGDAIEVVNLPPAAKPFGIETAQRSQALLFRNRMTEGRFQDTLRISVDGSDDDIQSYWKHWTGKTAREQLDAFRRATVDRSGQYRAAGGNAVEEARLRAQDWQAARANLLFGIRQDVVLQLRTLRALRDVRVLRGNALRVYFPYIPPGMGDPVHDPDPGLYGFWLSFTPGTETGPVLVPPEYLMPAR